jgi:signal transduction histidine kinase
MMSFHEEKKTTCLTTLINDVLEDLEILLKEKKVSIRMDKLPNLPVYPTRIRQLFLNLICNSIKYSREGITPVIDITREIRDDYCLISFADNGIGMTQDKLKKVFNPFCRLHSNDQIEGTGLGLSICQKVVNKHEGKIWAESQTGRGTVFKVLLPLDLQSAETAKEMQQKYA